MYEPGGETGQGIQVDVSEQGNNGSVRDRLMQILKKVQEDQIEGQVSREDVDQIMQLVQKLKE